VIGRGTWEIFKEGDGEAKEWKSTGRIFSPEVYCSGKGVEGESGITPIFGSQRVREASSSGAVPV